MSVTGQDIKKAAKILSEGGLVAIPTETVYGLSANAYNSDAVARIFEAKKRPHFDPLIVHTIGLDEARTFVKDIPDPGVELARKYWPGPLTLLLPRKSIIPDLVTSGMDRVAVRVPNHTMTDELLQSIDFPLVAPSANPFGYVSPTTAEHVEKQLGSEIDYILDGGDCHVGIESTIVGFDNGKPVIYRLGGLEKEKIEEIVGVVKVMPHSSSNPQAPGMLKSHYSPRKKVVMIKGGNIDMIKEDNKVGMLKFQPTEGSTINGSPEVVLTQNGNLREAAKNLFSALRKLDDMDIDIILAEKVPDYGLGMAINDRLKRASI